MPAAAAVTGTIDVAAALARRDDMTGNWDDAGALGWLEGEGIDLLRGTGRLAGEAEGITGSPVARGAVVPDGQRGVARPEGGLRPLTRAVSR